MSEFLLEVFSCFNYYLLEINKIFNTIKIFSDSIQKKYFNYKHALINIKEDQIQFLEAQNLEKLVFYIHLSTISHTFSTTHSPIFLSVNSTPKR